VVGFPAPVRAPWPVLFVVRGYRAASARACEWGGKTERIVTGDGATRDAKHLD